jgi:hypothetical protein
MEVGILNFWKEEGGFEFLERMNKGSKFSKNEEGGEGGLNF